MESSAKTQHFQWLQAHGYGLALDSMGQNEAHFSKKSKERAEKANKTSRLA
jgi:hypothetical protein